MQAEFERHVFPEKSGILLPPAGESPAAFGKRVKAETGGLMNFNRGTTTLGFITDGGLVLACDSRASQGQLVSSQTVRKILEINSYLLGTMAGGAADCSFWERHLAKVCALYELQNGARIPVGGAAQQLANIFYGYKGYGLSCGTMIAGYDQAKRACELYMVDDQGQRLQGEIFSVGSGSVYALSVLDAEYTRAMSKEAAVALARKAIARATHRDAASGGVCRIYWVDKEDWTVIEDGQDVNVELRRAQTEPATGAQAAATGAQAAAPGAAMAE